MTVKISYTEQDLKNLVEKSISAHGMKVVSIYFDKNEDSEYGDQIHCAVEIEDDGESKGLTQNVPCLLEIKS